MNFSSIFSSFSQVSIDMFNTTPATVGVHDGMYHLDELVALCLLKFSLKDVPMKVIRSRDSNELAKCTYILDVGMEYDGSTKYDHHQADCPVRDNGIPYASAGLIFKDRYRMVADYFEIKDYEGFYEEMESLILAIDAIDNGKSENDSREIKLPDLGNIVKTLGDFDMALGFVYGYLCKYIAEVAIKLKDKAIVKQAMEEAKDGILVLPKFCLGWKELTVDTDIKVALIPLKFSSDNQWSIISALKQKGSQECKCACPEHLRTAKRLGGNEVVFIHKSGFTGKVYADSLEQAYKSALAWVKG